MDLIFTFLTLLILIFVIFLGMSYLYGIYSGVPWVPSRNKTIEKMLDLADLKKGEVFIDPGCGDGRMVFLAEKRGAEARGYELAVLAFFAAKIWGFIANKKSQIFFKNFFLEDFSNADVIGVYLMPETLEKLKPKFKKELKKGTRIVSNAFQIKGWEPRKTIKKSKKQKSNIYLYVI